LTKDQRRVSVPSLPSALSLVSSIAHHESHR
jgi:hypothetical protein